MSAKPAALMHPVRHRACRTAKGGKIVAVETPIVDLPLRRLHRLSRADVSSQAFALCRIRTEDGIDGIGDAAVPGGPWWGGECAESVKRMIDAYIAPILIGRSVFDLNEIMNELDTHIFGNPVAKSAVEVAILDAICRSLDIPLAQYFGGAVRESIPCLWALATGKLEEDVREAEELVSQQRHAMFKIKLGFGTPQEDIERVIETSRRIDLPCSIDFNEAWDMAVATNLLPRLVDSRIELVEQPVSRSNLSGMAQLTARSPVAIMADEAACSPDDALAVIRASAASAISLKISKSGGPRKTQQIAQMTRLAGLGTFGGTALDSSIGVAASLQLFSTLPRLNWGCELFGPLLLKEDIVAEPLAYRDNAVHVPEGPGIGVTIDNDRLKHFAREGTLAH